MNAAGKSDHELTSDLARTIREDAAAAKANGGCNRIMSILSSPYMSCKICGLDGLCAACTSRKAAH